MKKLKIVSIMIQRILVFPFFTSIAFIGCMILFIKYMFHFLKYGGEAIAYTEKTKRTTIEDTFRKLRDIQINTIQDLEILV